MEKQFETTMKRRSQRERFYSSMNYDQYCEVYGPPSPLFKPQDDPLQDLPLFDLEEPPAIQDNPKAQPQTSSTLARLKMDTILEIDGSENFTQNYQRSPNLDLYFSNTRELGNRGTSSEIQTPKRMRVRMRSQSDNSEYLIFNFLQRINENGRKRIKVDE